MHLRRRGGSLRSDEAQLPWSLSAPFALLLPLLPSVQFRLTLLVALPPLPPHDTRRHQTEQDYDCRFFPIFRNDSPDGVNAGARNHRNSTGNQPVVTIRRFRRLNVAFRWFVRIHGAAAFARFTATP